MALELKKGDGKEGAIAMPSQVWNRSPREALDNPYEYGIQDQFFREAKKLLEELNVRLQKYSMKFHRDDQSVQKAVWMLQLDALDSLREALDALAEKKHRIAGQLFRVVVETLDLAAYFHSPTNEAHRHLKAWYKDKIIEHKIYRNFIKKTEGKDAAKAKEDSYGALSRLTHRTYGALLASYGLGQNDLIWHDSYAEANLLVLPETIAVYLTGLASLIIEFLKEVGQRGLLSPDEVREVFKNSLETETVPRRLGFLVRV